MKSFDTDLKKYAEKIRLKATERRELRERILSYMEYHPLPKQVEPIPTGAIASQEYFVWSPFNTMWARVATGAFALLLVIGVPLAAERSVPGDALYLVKTGLNEGIQSQFANSPYEKVVFETKLMERRISEARLLASEGKLTEEVEAAIAVTVKDHADAAQSGLAELRADNAEEAAIAEIAFGSALEVQSAVLDTNKSEGATSSIENILGVVNTTREQVEQNRGTTTPSYDGLVARIEEETTRAYELFETVKKSATEDEQADIMRRLADIDRQIVDAEKIRLTDELGATTELMGALGLTQKLIAFMTDIDVRETVELETLVPIVLTPEERIEAVNGSIHRIEMMRAELRTRLPLLIDAGLAEKVLFGMDQVSGLVTIATSSIAAGNVETAEQSSKEAEILMLDLEKMTQGVAVPDTNIPIDTPINEGSLPSGSSTPETGMTATSSASIEDTTEPVAQAKPATSRN